MGREDHVYTVGGEGGEVQDGNDECGHACRQFLFVAALFFGLTIFGNDSY